MHIPFFSVIIPIYNSEEYCAECVESILNQNFKNFEVLLIDDGSTDKSLFIITHLASLDKRIRVFHKSNGGAASARNEGIRLAQGKWLIFIDSDDYLGDQFLMSKIAKVSKKKNADVIKYGCTQVRDKDRSVIRKDCFFMERINKLESEEEKISELAFSDELSDSAWMHACKCSFIKKNNLFFDESLKSAEDIEWVFRLFLAKPKLYGINGSPYIYRIRENSQCTKQRETGFWIWRYKAIKKILKLLQESNKSEMELLPWYQYLAYSYYILLGQLIDEPDVKVRKKAFVKVHEFDKLQKYKGTKKVNFCRIIVKWGGIKLGAKLFNIYIHMRFTQKGVHKWRNNV